VPGFQIGEVINGLDRVGGAATTPSFYFVVLVF
jgi:hypothetical protein